MQAKQGPSGQAHGGGEANEKRADHRDPPYLLIHIRL